LQQVVVWSILRDLIILTITIDKHNSRNARMKRKNILTHKLMKNKQKVSGTSKEGETENYLQFSILEFNITQIISGMISFIPDIFTVSLFLVQ